MDATVHCSTFPVCPLSKEQRRPIEARLKEALSTAANREHRSFANMQDVLIWGYCGCNGIGITEQGDLLGDKKHD